MMGDNNMPWPQCGEIDIMEMGQENGIINGTSETYLNTAIHYGTDYESGHRQEYHADNVSQSLQDGKYHTYLLEWNEKQSDCKHRRNQVLHFRHQQSQRTL